MDRDRTYGSAPSRYPAAATAPDPMPNGPEKRPRSKAPVLVALMGLLIVVVVGTSVLVLQQIHAQQPDKAARASRSTLVSMAPTSPATTATPDLTLPANNGWKVVAPDDFGDIQFAASAPQDGYLCGTGSDGKSHVFGVTSDGGQTWSIGASPASYLTCSLQVSPSNPLDLTLTSVNAPGDGQTTYVESHYSTDGGRSWRAAPIPPNDTGPASLLWSGHYLYLILSNTLQVSANGGAFTPVDLSGLVPGASQMGLTNSVAAADRYYLNVQTSACQSPCGYEFASADGGATWTKVPNQGNIQLDGVVGNIFYGSVRSGPYLQSYLQSSDGGVSWSTMQFPAVSDGNGFQWYVVSAGQTVLAENGDGVYALVNGSWRHLAVSSSNLDSVWPTAVSLDVSGQPARVWGHDEGQHPGVYWHSL